MSKSIASFDVYETLLFRMVGHHESAHQLLGNLARTRGLIDQPASIFATARKGAEMRARRREGGSDTTLHRIHTELADGLGYGEDRFQELLELELELEERITTSHPSARRMVAAARAARREVIFVSDMYLPQDFIRDLLIRHDLFQEGDRLYVSSAHDGATKRNGGLFAKVLSFENEAARRIVHIGNSFSADVKVAQRYGLRVRPQAQGNLNRFESVLEEYSTETAGLTSVMAGASRLTRLDGRSTDARSVSLREVAAGVVAPTLTGFVLWLLRRAKHDSVSRLYFLAREGQVLHDIAAQLVEKLGLSIDVRYLYISRQSVNLAASRGVSRGETDWLLTHAASNSIRTILARLGAEPEHIAEHLIGAGWSQDSWDAVVGIERFPHILRLIEGEARTAIEARMDTAKEIAVDYLYQEGVLDDVPIGLVDSTGGGSQLRAVDRLRRSSSLPPMHGYLIFRGLPNFSTVDDEARYTRGWFGDEVRATGFGPTPGRAALLELFCAADHGTTLGYERNGGRVEPRLSHMHVDDRIQWGLPVVRAAIADFLENLCLDREYVDLWQDTRGGVGAAMALLWERPSRDEAAAWGRFPFEGASGREAGTSPLASGYSGRQVLLALARGELRDRRWFEWPAASLQLTNTSPRIVIRLVRRAKKAVLGQSRLIRSRMPAWSWRMYNRIKSRGRSAVSGEASAASVDTCRAVPGQRDTSEPIETSQG